MAARPLVFDCFCGLGGWAEGFLAEGYDVIGFDIERHRYPERMVELAEDATKSMHGKDRHGNTLINRALEQVHGFHRAPLTGEWKEYPGHLVLQDVMTIHGSQFRDAAVIVASPPCQEFSYMAMPWKRAKQIARALRGQDEFPAGYTGSRTIEQLTALFDACFRIQREASEAAGRHIPLVVENVKGAQPWVGRARWHYGSFYLWGDVPALMPHTLRAQKFNPDGTAHGQGSWFAIADSKERGSGRKVPGMNFHEYEKTGKPGRSFQSAAVEHTKNSGGSWFAVAHNTESGHSQNPVNGTKVSGDWFGSYAEMKSKGQISPGRLHGKGSPARKQASAEIAKIPFDLANWIARAYKPAQEKSA